MPELEAHAITNFFTRCDEQMKAIETERQALASALLESAPSSLRKFFENVDFILDLVKYGKANSEFDQDEIKGFGYRDLKEFEQGLIELKETIWKEIAEVSFISVADASIHVFFTAI